MEILAVIPARGGSKGILKKNTRLFAGKPLLAHSIDHAKASKYISRIIVSTETSQIAEVAKKNGAEVPFLRPKKLATDKSMVVDAVIDLLEKLERKEGYVPDILVLLQPTSPLRTVDDVDASIQLLTKRKASAVLTVCSTEPLVFTKDSKDFLHLESNSKFLKSPNRQELAPTYRFNGCTVYAIKVETLLKERTFVPKSTCAQVIPRWRSVDLDEPEDFVIGELIYQNRRAIEKTIETF
jgi:CMP-N,N'-diacetyllegionaminic acid synthase